MLFYWRKETRSDLRSVLKAVKCWRISEHQWNTNISLISPCSLTEISAAHRSRHSFSRLDHAVVRVDATVQTGRDEGGMNSPAWAGRWSQSSRRSWCRGKRSTSPSPCSSCSGYLRKTNTRASLLLLFSSRKNLAGRFWKLSGRICCFPGMILGFLQHQLQEQEVLPLKSIFTKGKQTQPGIFQQRSC